MLLLQRTLRGHGRPRSARWNFFMDASRNRPTMSATVRAGGALLVTMFAYSGVRKLGTPFSCDEKQLTALLGKRSCDATVKALLVAAGLHEVVTSAVVYAWALGVDTGRWKQYAVDGLIGFTVLVTLLFKVPRRRVIATLSNTAVVGGLLLLRDA